ncbi:uncharacterized protein TNCT_573891 [Trichonephila clavata]|uniref:Uncharacterized protein n=1 Tax=Trichonephila clavata TaxID=2740835 RepID=A0A8X6KDP7_TRICU|nr:uncharacterized protein TNCT_573891 [Trichonephila clavata]
MNVHDGIFTREQERSLKFYFNANVTVNRVKTADLFIHSKWLDAKTRFVLACQLWLMFNVLKLFYSLHESEKEEILNKYSTANENFNVFEKNVVLWIKHYKAGYISESQSSVWCYIGYNWNYASLGSRILNDLTEEERQSLLDHTFEHSNWISVRCFCLFNMSADRREVLLKRFPLKVLRIYLYSARPHFFLNAVDKVWDRLPGKHFICLLYIIICQKIVALWKDIDYVNLLRQLWHRSPDHLKLCVEGTDIYEILI